VKLSKKLTDALLIALGSTVFAVAVNVFYAPFQIVPGGLTGISMLIHEGLPGVGVGVMVFVLNVPLFLLGWRFLGKQFLLLTFFGTFCNAVAIEALGFLPAPADLDPLMAALMGGVLSGAGLGLVFWRGGTTGGSDIIARLTKVGFPHIQIGRLIFLIDGMVILASGLVFGSFRNAAYAAVAVYVSTITIDGIVYGAKTARVCYIISQRTQEVVEVISQRLERGATLLNAEGSYTGSPRQVILCAVDPRQVPMLKEAVQAVDGDAFFILLEAHEVLGQGFGRYDKHAL
jgi:uncharacterized membrane-anchored protein YitT (DUF2179 family)